MPVLSTVAFFLQVGLQVMELLFMIRRHPMDHLAEFLHSLKHRAKMFGAHALRYPDMSAIVVDEDFDETA